MPAQSIDLSPVQTLLQGIVDPITGPPGTVIGTLVLIGVFPSWLFGILDFRRALWIVVAIVGIAVIWVNQAAPMADQSCMFIGLPGPPKLMGLPIMYAMVCRRLGSTLPFLWVQGWAAAVVGGLACAAEGGGLGSELTRPPDDHLAGNPAHAKPQAPRRRQLCPVTNAPAAEPTGSIR